MGSSSSSTGALGKQSTALDVVNAFGGPGVLAGKTAVVTGGNSGIGTETVKQLVFAGAHVIVGSRSIENGIAALKEAGVDATKTTVLSVELEDLHSVAAFAAKINELPRVDLLVLNAGIMALPTLQYSKHGFEKQIAVNHYGHFHLLTLVLEKMKAQTFPSRVIALSSLAHDRGQVDLADIHFKNGRAYTPWGAYGQSKSANILMIRELADRLGPDSKITCLSLHPGVIKTGLTRNMNVPAPILFLIGWMIFDKSIEQGAATTLTACLNPALTANSGSYLSDCQILETNAHCQDVDKKLRQGLWKASVDDIAAALAAAK